MVLRSFALSFDIILHVGRPSALSDTYIVAINFEGTGVFSRMCLGTIDIDDLIRILKENRI
jgi:hypothetical protein